MTNQDPILSVQNSKKGGRHRKKQLYNSILLQMEFYFSTSNLSKDRYLSQLIAEDPYVNLEVFLNFNKVKKLTDNIEDIQKALSKSDLIELSEDKTKVRRKFPLKVKDNIDDCTIYVQNIKSESDHEGLTSIFSEFGNVVYVSIPKYKLSKANKGFAFVEFETDSEAESAVNYFESIGCKIPADTNPGDLKSIATFEGPDTEPKEDHSETVVNENEDTSKKRKLCEDNNLPQKKLKKDDNSEEESSTDTDENKIKKKLKKEQKKKTFYKELGFQVLSKKEWKKMRNRYLDLQRKKMKEFKQYLYRNRYSQKSDNGMKKQDNLETEMNESPVTKLEFQPGLIAKLKLSEPCEDAKKLKSDIKSYSDDIKYVDIPVNLQQEVFIRFGDGQSAKQFCESIKLGEATILCDEEENQYWEKIHSDRDIKFSKSAKKQRGRDRLLQKAAKEAAHIRFEDTE